MSHRRARLSHEAPVRPVADAPPRSYRRPDVRIREEIADRLIDHEVDLTGIVIEVVEGDAVITGTVSDGWTRQRIEEIAASVPGVERVYDHLALESHRDIAC